MKFDYTKGKKHRYTVFAHYNPFMVDNYQYSTLKDAENAFKNLKEFATPETMILLFDCEKESYRKTWKFGES